MSSACDGLPENSTDTRFPASLPDGPFQITASVPYFDSHVEYSKFGQCEFFGAYAGDPIHRFYQMWQQSAAFHDRLATWVINTAGDDNGALPPEPIYQGGVQMGFYNMAQGDAPILRDLAQHYAISDNYHQAVQGGTGTNHIALGTGFAASYQNSSGQAAVPPPGEIENPTPKPGTNNNYTQNGYGSSTVANTGGSYSECADRSQPGVGPIFDYLSTLPYKVLDNCQPGRYYLLNNYNPGYNANGSLDTAPYTVPPQKTDYVTIGNELSAHGISWGYFGEGYNNGNPTPDYCGICDPMQYSASIMTNPVLRSYTQHDSNQFIADAAAGTLPAVSFLKPGDDDGHPRLLDAGRVRELRRPRDRRDPGQPEAVADHRDLRHLRRERRLLRLRVHPAGQLLRRRSPGPAAGDLAVRPARLRRPHLHRSRLDPEVHRGQLGPAPADLLQRGQPAQRDARRLRAEGPARDRQPDDPVRLPQPPLRHAAASGQQRAPGERADGHQRTGALSAP